MAVKPGRVNQAHDGRGPLAGAQGAGKHPVVAANGNREDLVLDPLGSLNGTIFKRLGAVVFLATYCPLTCG